MPPILASLVRKDADANAMLDDCSKAKSRLKEVKERLHGLIAGADAKHEVGVWPALTFDARDPTQTMPACLSHPQLRLASPARCPPHPALRGLFPVF